MNWAGLRQVDGETLALLRRRDEDADGVIVLPVEAAAVRRLSRLALGDVVTVTARGAIQRSKVQTSKGRRR
jgi:hypothetical protein